MQYVRSVSSSVSKTWNSINPATLSGAIDVIVVEQEDGSLACSPFHVRFGKFSLLRPSEKKVEFQVNDVKQDFAMKLGDGGEAFFVFETSDDIPEDLQTSPLVSPAMAPKDAASPLESSDTPNLQEPDFLDLATEEDVRKPLPEANLRARSAAPMLSTDRRAHSDLGTLTPLSMTVDDGAERPASGDWAGAATSLPDATHLDRAMTDGLIPMSSRIRSNTFSNPHRPSLEMDPSTDPMANANLGLAPPHARTSSPPPVPTKEAVDRAKSLSKKLSGSNIPTRISDSGDLMLDMTGYKSSEDEALRAEVIARKILSEELEGNYDIGALIGADERGNLWIYSSEEAKEAAGRKATEQGLAPGASLPSDAVSDPGYHSDGENSTTDTDLTKRLPHFRRESDPAGANGLVTPPQTPPDSAMTAGDPNRNYAKTLRLTSDQLMALGLRPGANSMSFSVNRATCTAYMYYWKYDVPILISDIDGTITKSDALGHVLNMIGRDWTHLGVAKLYTDIVANGYNIMYLTSRSVGQADTTRSYLKNVIQDTHRLPKGPVIMSPDRTIAALRREIYLRKPEVFKMACLRDILNLFGRKNNPFYAGFGNRLTDALSYRSVNIPSTRIFTINTNAEVSLDLLSLNKYKSSYVTMREIVDHFFPPVGLLVTGGGEEFTDFNYWRDRPLALEDFSASDSEDEDEDENSVNGESVRSEDEGSEGMEEEDARHMEDSFISRGSFEDEGDLADSILESEGPMASSMVESRADVDEETSQVAADASDPSEIADEDIGSTARTNGHEPHDERHASAKVLIGNGISGPRAAPLDAITSVTASIQDLALHPSGAEKEEAEEEEKEEGPGAEGDEEDIDGGDLEVIGTEPKADPSVKDPRPVAPE